MKRCTKCGEMRPLEDFHRDRRSADGRKWYCKDCVAKQQAEYKARPEVKAAMRAADKHASQIPGTYRYDRAHGIGRPGEAARAASKRRTQTLGTYRYNEAHGIGRPGEVRRVVNRRGNATPGTYNYARSHGIGLLAAERNARKRIRRAEKRLAQLQGGNDVG